MRQCHGIVPKIFCLRVPKNFVGEPCRVSLIPISKRVRVARGRAGFTIIRRNCFVSQ